MKTARLIFILLSILAMQRLSGQPAGDPLRGTVSYVTSQQVYVKFGSTASLTPGDTLYFLQNSKPLPVLQITNLSSIFCVCTPIHSALLKVGDEVLFYPVQDKSAPGVPAQAEVSPLAPDAIPPTDQPPVSAANMPSKSDQQVPGQSLTERPAPAKPAAEKRQDLYGFVAVAAYSNLSNTTGGNNLKMKYTLSLNLKNIGNSNVSAESYLVFTHRDKQWSEIQQDVFNGLKIYNLSVNYRFLNRFTVLLGRKINPRLSNVGAIDGLQFDMRFNHFTIGIVAGSRPDYTNYGFDFSLLQFGLYAAHDKNTRNGYLQTTLAFMQQMNSGKTDRQFLYLQHANSVVKNLTFFGSAEVDLYRQELNPADSTYSPETSPRLTNLYLSLSYRLLRKADFTFSYSARKNVIYYETYKNVLDQLIDQETRQGYNLRINYRPVKLLSIGVSGGYRFQPDDLKPSRNVYAFLSYSRIPGIQIGVTGSFTWLETSYISGNIYGIGVSRDFLKGRLYTGLSYKYVDYKLYSTELNLPQNVAEVNLTWRIIRRLSLSVYYEGTFQDIDTFNRIYAQVQVRL